MPLPLRLFRPPLLLLKRIAAGIIDISLFVGAVLLSDWFFYANRIGDFQSGIALPLSFICVFALPIIVFTRTIGEVTMQIKYVGNPTPELKLKVFGKYLILYCLSTLEMINIGQMVKSFFESYTYLAIPLSLILRLYIVFTTTNFLFFIISFGKKSLLDVILKIDYDYNSFTLHTATYAPYIFASLFIFSMGVERKVNDYFRISEFIAATGTISNNVHFPVDEFDRFTVPGQIYYRLSYTNIMATPADENSFIDNKYFYQRQIQADVKDDIVVDPKLRAALCAKLINYCYGIYDLADSNSLVTQTKIELTHVKYFTPYLGVISYYNYYYDDKMNTLGLYGGFSSDSLNRSYFRIRQDIIDTFSSFISKATGQSQYAIKTYFKEGRAAEMVKGLPSSITIEMNKIDFTSVLNKRLASLRPIPFDSTKPVKRLMFMYPALVPQIFGDQFYETQFMGAMFLKNNHFLVWQSLDDPIIVSHR